MRAGPVVCAVDLTESSDRALASARALARSVGRSVVVLHAIEVGALSSSEARAAESLASAVDRQTNEALEALLERQGASGDVRAVLVHGSAPTAIVSYAEHEDAAALACATAGRSGAARLVIGSVAERIVRTAPCPVLTVGPDARDLELGRIAVALDPFDSSSIDAAEVALELTRTAGSEVVLVHAWMPPPPVSGAGLLVPMDERRASAIGAVIDRLRRGGVEIAAHPVIGDPYVAITTAAEDLGAGLLVCGTRQRTGVARLLLGSVAERLVRTSRCPVLTVGAR